MIIKKLHTPEGVKDYLPSECILKTKIENKKDQKGKEESGEEPEGSNA